MNIPNLTSFSKLSIRNQLVITFCAGIGLLTIISTFLISTISAQTVYEQLVSQGENITQNLADQSVLPLLYESPDSAKTVANSTLEFPDVTHVSIYNASTTLLYRQGETQLDPMRMSWPTKELQTINDENFWYFIAPVTSRSSSEDKESPFGINGEHSELIGYVQVSISKDTLNSMNREILTSNLAVAGGIACFLLLVLFGITRRLTSPLQELASAMRKAELGESGVRTQLNGSSDIIVMEKAFNKMMDELESRENELVKARDVALDAAKAKGIFAATVSHELRTPMNGVLGMLQLIEAAQLTPQVKECVEIAKTSAKALLVLIDDILDFSKIESGKMKFHMEDFGIRELTFDIVELLSLQASQKGLMLHTIVDSSVPIGITADAGRIRQVLINLIGNAIKFTSQGHVTVYTSVVMVGDVKMLKFEVNDTGIGIAEEAQKRIFDSFVQADGSTTRRYGGTGLGLTICQQLVKLMGGELQLTSAIDEGSTFSFTLPLKVAGSDFSSVDEDPFKLKGIRALIVGDSIERLETLNLLLLSWKCNTERIADAKKALTKISEAISDSLPYDLVILDLPLSGIDSEEVFTGHSCNTNTHFIILSDTEAESCVTLPSVTYLPKAVNSASIYKATQRSVEEEKVLIDAHPTTASSIKVLVVEDNRTNQLVAIGMLERLGYMPDIASDGQEAIEKISQTRYDIVLMDCHMPGMDGYIATQEIRKKETADDHLPILAMTAHTSSDDRDKCLASGMDDYLSKPIEQDQLQTKLALWLKVDDRNEQLPREQIFFQEEAVKLQGPFDIEEDEPSIDEDKINGLKDRLDSTFTKVVSFFLEDSAEYVNQIEQALIDNDLSRAREVAHTLLGSSANVGAKNLAKLCKKLEHSISESDSSHSNYLLQKIREEHKQVSGILKEKAFFGADSRSKSGSSTSRVLVVDDDRSARFAIHGILERDGYEIIEAENGMRALEICQDKMPELILMDAMMPEMDGFIACQKILQLSSNTQPVILIITALHDEESIEKAFNCGATDYIPKPVNLMLLRRRISRLLQSSLSERQLHKLTFYDPLTSLPNLELFMDRSRELIRRAYQKRLILGLLSIDLDKFSQVNEMYGYGAGDLVLKSVAQRLETCFRSSDIVARIRGDEFAVMLEAVQSQDSISTIARKVHHELSQPYMLQGQRVYINVSIGIASYPHNSNSIDNLLHSAETARYKAKTKGGNGIQVYELEMENEFILQVEMEKELQRAIREHELVMFYQPRVNLETGKACSLETIIRWQHPNRGLMPASEFMPVAQNSGMLEEISIWMIETVCKQQGQWLDQGLQLLPISLDFSQSHFSETLVAILDDAITRSGINSQLINIAITENSLGEKTNNLSKQLAKLKEMGTAIEITEFGKSSTSLNYLRNLPVSAVIIDDVLVRDLVEDESSVAIVEGIIKIVHRLNLQVGAHGVDTKEKEMVIQRLGCDIMQGKIISAPLKADQCEAWIRALPQAVSE